MFNTGKDTAKGRALARDPRIAICVDLEQPPWTDIDRHYQALRLEMMALFADIGIACG